MTKRKKPYKPAQPSPDTKAQTTHDVDMSCAFPCTRVLFWLISIALLLPWLAIQYRTSINADSAWLTLCATRLIDGGSILHDCMDPNPPLSILIYAPFVWLSRISTIPVYYVLFFLTLFLTALSVITTRTLLNPIKALTSYEKDIFTLGFLCTLTILPSFYFTERDHFLAIALLPLILLLREETYRQPDEKPALPFAARFLVLIFGAVTILLKPPYALIPAFFQIHRVIKQKRLLAVFDYDFLILLASALIYAATLFLFFGDFLNVILPDVIKLYLPYADLRQTISAGTYLIAYIVFCMLIALFAAKPEARRFFLELGACALLCMAAYIAQRKGWGYQRIPSYALLFTMGSCLLYHVIPAKIKQHSAATNAALFLLISGIVVASSYRIQPLRPQFPDHETYRKNNPVTQYINAHCDTDKQTPCRFYIEQENLDIVSQLAFYAPSPNSSVSRFPILWPLSGLLGDIIPLPPEEELQTKLRYINYLAEDINRHKPQLVFIFTGATQPGEQNSDKSRYETILDYCGNRDELSKTIRTDYKKVDTLQVDRAYFYKGTKHGFPYILNWDVYKRTHLQK